MTRSISRSEIKDRKVTFTTMIQSCYLEAVLARGDRRLSQGLKGLGKGCKFDGWSELFYFEKWMEAFEETGIDGDFYALSKGA